MKVIIAREFVDGTPCPFAEEYLESFDFEADDGCGHGVFTPDLAKAMKFPDATAALTYWRTKSKCRPIREDGRPNRPLTCTTIMICDLDDERARQRP
jgi:hypothetical protein